MWHNIADIYHRFKQLSTALQGIGMCADADRRRSLSSRAMESSAAFSKVVKILLKNKYRRNLLIETTLVFSSPRVL
jgi:hypothetical protein